MKKEYWFAIILSVGVLVIILFYSYFQRIQVIPEITSVLAIYISIVTAGYTAIAKPNPTTSTLPPSPILSLYHNHQHRTTPHTKTHTQRVLNFLNRGCVIFDL